MARPATLDFVVEGFKETAKVEDLALQMSRPHAATNQVALQQKIGAMLRGLSKTPA